MKLEAMAVNPRDSMISANSILMHDKIIAGVDTETTGLLGGDHKIVEIYIGLWKNGKRIFEYDQRVNPERSIPVESTNVHGIVASDVAFSPVWSKVGPTVDKILRKSDFTVFHNGFEFDWEMIRSEQDRLSITMPSIPMMDTMRHGGWATPVGKSPNLQELCFACGVEYDTAKSHAAYYDVEVMMASFFKGCEYGFFDMTKVEIPS